MTKDTCASRIKKALSIKDMKQSELCDLTGIPKSAMSQYISGAFEPKQDRVYLIAKELNVSEAWLMGYDVSMGRTVTAFNSTTINDFGTSTISNIRAVDIGEYVKVPILGTVSAGLGCIADNEIVGYEPWTASSIKRGHEYFTLTVQGESMYPKLEEGDMILVQSQNSVDSGKIAVLTVNGDEGVIKKVSYGKDWIELHSINPMFPVRRFEGEDVLKINIIGLVIESKRKF